MRRHPRRGNGPRNHLTLFDRGGTRNQPAAGAVTATSVAEPGTNPQPARNAHGKSREIAQRFTVEAFEALADVMQDEEAAATARVNAANTILEWGHGKRGDAAKPAEVIEKVIKVDWGKE